MKSLNADRIVSLSAIFISLGTLFVFVYQTNLIRKEQKASVIPYLMIGMTTNVEGQSINVTNGGLGPAIIRSVRVIDSLGAVKGGVYDYTRERLGEQSSDFESITLDLLIPGRLIPSKERLEVFAHSREGPLSSYIRETFRFPFNESGHAILEIDYESVYGDRWRVRSDVFAPEVAE